VSEVQALVAATPAPTPRRAVSGLDSARVAMVLAVLARRAGLPLLDREVYAATVGGVRLSEPAADLAVALAVASATVDVPLPPGLVAVGEVGLAAEVRQVTAVGRRLAEASRLGFASAVVPAGCAAAAPPGMAVVEVGDLHQALAAVGPGRPPPID
jgi:DNA repair protein RadA/Sms